MEKTELKKKIRRFKVPGFVKISDLCDWIKEHVDVNKTSKLTINPDNIEIVEWEEEFCLSNGRRTKWDIVHGDDDGFFYKGSFVKEFIGLQLERISHEQLIAKDRNHQRSLLFLKSNLEKDAGRKLLELKYG